LDEGFGLGGEDKNRDFLLTDWQQYDPYQPAASPQQNH